MPRGFNALTKAEGKRLSELKDQAKYDGRCALSIWWHTDEALADEHGKLVEKTGATYNGGWFHGMECGREKTRDYMADDGTMRYAVTE